MTSSNITRLNLGKRNFHWCILGATVSCQLITTCVCANLWNKYSPQFRVLFRVQKHTTMGIIQSESNYQTPCYQKHPINRLTSHPFVWWINHSNSRHFSPLFLLICWIVENLLCSFWKNFKKLIYICKVLPRRKSTIVFQKMSCIGRANIKK